MKKDVQGGIISAGKGERFQKAGFTVPKPMIEVGGIPLIGRTVSAFKDAGIRKINIVFNSENIGPCREYLYSEFRDMDFNIMCRDTRTSAETFLTLVTSVPDTRLVITTVDSIYTEDSFGAFVSYASGISPQHLCLGMSSYIDDEKPLYISVDDKGAVTSLGEEKSVFVTCGAYYLDSSVVRGYNHKDFPALRKFLGRLFTDGLPVTGFDMGRVMDIDRPEDLYEAEKEINELRGLENK